MCMRYFIALILALGMAVPSVEGAGTTQARLLWSAESARPGETITAAVELQMAPRWHTYWKNAGESGMATKIDWTLPDGITAGEIQWPVPEKYTAAGLTTYVYHNSVLLLVPLTIAPDSAPGTKSLRAKVSWLECEEVCLPGGATVSGKFEVGTESKPSSHAELIASWQKRLPLTRHSLEVRARWDGPAVEEKRPLIIEWQDSSQPVMVDFFPYAGDDYEVGGATDVLGKEGGKILLRKQVTKFGDHFPSSIQGILVAKASEGGAAQGYEVTLPISEPSNLTATGSSSAEGTRAAPTAPVLEKRSLWVMLGLAFLGGLILNIMPCVLPVIALKVLGFVSQSREEPGRVRLMGLVYALGVLASFMVLAALVIGMQAAGRAANWGMQFQNPQFLVVMTVLVTLVALNLFGLFEITLSGRAMGAAGALASKEGASGAFFNGVLATALATPCTAPFLGAALGFAFAQPPSIIILTFVAVALGLAAPYVVLSWNPGWLKWVPKPGAWMERFKVAMGFPMLATAIWLFWLTTSHFDKSGALWLGLFLVALAMAAWIWGEFVQRGLQGRTVAMVLSGLIAVGAYYYALEKQLSWRAPVVVAKAGELKRAQGAGIDWQVWSPEAVEKARAAGRPVLVDFTADWCLTCQVNKKTSLEIPAVQEKLKEINAVALLGDHTHADPLITEELKKHQRAGVPLVLVYPPKLDAPPIVLPEVLTPGIVLDALEKVQ